MCQICCNCHVMAGYPHKADCPRPKFHGDADLDSPVGRRQELHEETILSDLEADPLCPMCQGPPVHLGDLGSVTHYRCRNCGYTYHEETL